MDPDESGYDDSSTPSVSADLPMSLLSVFSNYWHRFIISDAFINYLANPVYYVSVFPLSYFYQYIAVMTSTKLVAMAMHKHDAMLGGRESILLTVIGKKLFFGYPNKLIPM